MNLTELSTWEPLPIYPFNWPALIILQVCYNAHYMANYLPQSCFMHMSRYTLNAEATDEIQEYIQARYLSASEAAWRIFGFHVNQREPSVSALTVHLPGEDSLLFSSENVERFVATTVSMLDRYFPSQQTPCLMMYVTVSIMNSSWCLIMPYHMVPPRIGGTRTWPPDVRVPEAKRREDLQDEHAVP